MTVENIVYGVCGVGIGVWGLTVTVWAYEARKTAKAAVKALITMPSPEQLAKEILKVKLPMSDIPPEALKDIDASIQQEMEKLGKNDMRPEKSNYIG